MNMELSSSLLHLNCYIITFDDYKNYSLEASLVTIKMKVAQGVKVGAIKKYSS